MRTTPFRRRLVLLLGVLLALGAATALVLDAFRSNLVFFYSPSQLAAREAPAGRTVRLGGLVQAGSLQRHGVDIGFGVSDSLHTVAVRYRGLLPDLFREGKGVVVQGRLRDDGVFAAHEVLAKHDENYMPREATPLMQPADGRGAQRVPPADRRGAQPAQTPARSDTQLAGTTTGGPQGARR
jgi:cytochrome c-type biogenesis protein CcmE